MAIASVSTCYDDELAKEEDFEGKIRETMEQISNETLLIQINVNDPSSYVLSAWLIQFKNVQTNINVQDIAASMQRRCLVDSIKRQLLVGPTELLSLKDPTIPVLYSIHNSGKGVPTLFGTSSPLIVYPPLPTPKTMTTRRMTASSGAQQPKFSNKVDRQDIVLIKVNMFEGEQKPPFLYSAGSSVTKEFKRILRLPTVLGWNEINSFVYSRDDSQQFVTNEDHSNAALSVVAPLTHKLPQTINEEGNKFETNYSIIIQ